MYQQKLVSTCALFTSEELGLAKAVRVLRPESTIPEMLSYFVSIGSEEQFRRMCVFDALILNPDRHLGNFGVLFDNDALTVRGMALVCDNNRSLFPELDEDQLAAPEWYIGKCRPRIGRDFITTARGLLTDQLRQDLNNMEGFRLTPPSEIEISQNRLDLPSKLVNRQIQRILE